MIFLVKESRPSSILEFSFSKESSISSNAFLSLFASITAFEISPTTTPIATPAAPPKASILALVDILSNLIYAFTLSFNNLYPTIALVIAFPANAAPIAIAIDLPCITICWRSLIIVLSTPPDVFPISFIARVHKSRNFCI